MYHFSMVMTSFLTKGNFLACLTHSFYLKKSETNTKCFLTWGYEIGQTVINPMTKIGVRALTSEARN